MVGLAFVSTYPPAQSLSLDHASVSLDVFVGCTATKALATFVAADPTRAKEVRQLHRGLSVTLNLTPGHEFTTWDFTSTSQDGSQGFKFASKTYESILNGCGIDVSELSVYASEREVLILPGARFRVVDVFRPDKDKRPDFYHVVLERRPRLLQGQRLSAGAGGSVIPSGCRLLPRDEDAGLGGGRCAV